MPLTEKKKISNKRSQNKNNKRFSIIVGKYDGLVIDQYLKDTNSSINGFFVQAVKEKIERETGKKFDDLMSEMRTADEVGSAETAEDPSAKAGRE